MSVFVLVTFQGNNPSQASREREDYPNSMPWANGISPLQLIVVVWRRM